MRSALRRLNATALPVALAAASVLSGTEAAAAMAQPAGNSAVSTSAETQAAELKAARAAVVEQPNSAEAHMRLGDLLHKAGRDQEATEQYVQAVTLKPDLYVAYHQIGQCTSDKDILEKAIAKLTEDEQKQPHELMLRVALSELLEKCKSYYPAAKALIEIQYDDAVPPRYRPRVEARIHYLLTKAHEAQLKQEQPAVANDEELDVLPAPVPKTSLRKGLTASKIKDSRELKGMGHVPLLP